MLINLKRFLLITSATDSDFQIIIIRISDLRLTRLRFEKLCENWA